MQKVNSEQPSVNRVLQPEQPSSNTGSLTQKCVLLNFDF